MLDLRTAFDCLGDAVMYGCGNEALAGISTDSRHNVAGSLYVPLRGERFDGHDYIGQARAAGAAACLFEAGAVLRENHGVVPPAIRVPDTRRALGELACGWRARFALPVIGVTGSNGKTTVKEMLATILAAAVGPEAVLATRGNFNNDIGVPLTIFRLREQHRLAVIELGMNHPGEIAWIAQIAQATIALVNNAQREHQEFLDSVEATALENGAALTALPADGVAVFPGDDACTPIWRELAAGRKTLCFGLGDDAGQFDVQAAATSLPQRFTIKLSGRALNPSRRSPVGNTSAGSDEFVAALAIDGVHNVRNALAATACALAAGISPEVIASGLAQFQPAQGRMRRVSAAAGVVLIDDTYNANPDSVRAAIEALATQPAPRVLVLGDMAEIGHNGPQWHAEIGAYARASGITRLLALGPLCRDAVAAFGAGAEHFDTMPAVIDAAIAATATSTSVLVKGSRAMQMEAVVAALSSAAAQTSAVAGNSADVVESGGVH